jgi:cytochrome c biogenesis protein CcmG/thiol:disulfide interchange protein DsbE
MPAIIFALVLVVFYDQLMNGQPNAPLPSPLIGKPVPEFQPMALDAETLTFSRADLTQGRPVVVNFWASWCAPCVLEAPVLTRLSERPGVTVYGFAYKDEPANSRSFLAKYGNPFTAINNDPQGFGAIDWGVTAVPETFVVDGNGMIRARVVGQLTDQNVRDVILPALENAGS